MLYPTNLDFNSDDETDLRRMAWITPKLSPAVLEATTVNQVVEEVEPVNGQLP